MSSARRVPEAGSPEAPSERFEPVARRRPGCQKERVRRFLYLSLGFAALALGAVGTIVPLLPTVPFVLLAAFFFARSSPQLEARLIRHPRFGPHIRAWRECGAVSRSGKRAALAAFALSAALGLLLLPFPWLLVPFAAAVAGGTWIWRRPEA